MDRSELRLSKKSVFDVRRLCFLGHVVSERGLEPLQRNVEIIKKASAPSDVTMQR